jgi:hypothetical protein
MSLQGPHCWQQLLKEQFDEVVVHLNRSTAEADLEQPLTLAAKAGKKRGPRTQEFIVHPDFPWHPNILRKVGDAAIAGQRPFADDLQKVLRTSPAPIVDTYPGSASHRVFDYEPKQSIETAPLEMHGGSIIGMLEREAIDRLLHLLNGIHPDDRFIVHGAALGRCPTQFSIQLNALAAWKVFLPPLSHVHPFSCPERQHHRVAERVMYETKLFREKFQMGCIHNTCYEQRLDGLTADLFGPQTRVYSHGEKTETV